MNIDTESAELRKGEDTGLRLRNIKGIVLPGGTYYTPEMIDDDNEALNDGEPPIGKYDLKYPVDRLMRAILSHFVPLSISGFDIDPYCKLIALLKIYPYDYYLENQIYPLEAYSVGLYPKQGVIATVESRKTSLTINGFKVGSGIVQESDRSLIFHFQEYEIGDGLLKVTICDSNPGNKIILDPPSNFRNRWVTEWY